ncbi:MAG: PilZ domain-containing protein [Betaproteobacteria bacterium]
MTANRRRFSRILFQSEALLRTSEAEFGVNVVDISLKGALVKPKGAAYAGVGTNCTLLLVLGDPEASIRMETTVVHHQGENLGLACREIDLDSMTHLRRLVELNLGDAPILNRELSALAAPE